MADSVPRCNPDPTFVRLVQKSHQTCSRVSCAPPAEAEQPDASVVEVVVNILGYNLDPFTTTQEDGLKDAMVNELPELQSPVRCSL